MIDERCPITDGVNRCAHGIGHDPPCEAHQGNRRIAIHVMTAKCACGAELGYVIPESAAHRVGIAQAFRDAIDAHEIGCKKKITLSTSVAQ